MSSLTNLSVLVVDDDEGVRELTCEVLRELGIGDIKTAVNGRDALDVLRRGDEAPDIILSDIDMPDMDGIELMRHLGDRQVRSGIILVSGRDARILHVLGGLSRSHGLHLIGLIEKPLEISRLVTLLEEYSVHRSTEKQAIAPSIREDELTAASIEASVIPFFQPQVDGRTGHVHGAEALARWVHPTHGLLGPGAFIPLVEATGLIDVLTDTVLHRAIAQCAAWNRDGLDLHVSVNLAMDNLQRLDLPEYILNLARSEGVQPERIVVELTEGQLMKNLRSSMEILSRLRLKGLGLSIDDFGTGYSSMEQLKRAPFSELKIDRSFVFGASDDPAARAILESSITLARKLNMVVVAEGAESQADWDLAVSSGSDLVQGYIVAKPMSGEAIATWVKARVTGPRP